VERRTASGQVLGEGERVTAAEALTLYTGRRRVAPGEPADLCLLAVPLRRALRELDGGVVARTVGIGP
jgi:hypothetical protein